MQTLTFALKGESFAVAIDAVKEIIEYPELTEIPLTPPVLKGVMNLRGAVIPVIDLGERFGLGAVTQGRRTCVIIFEIRGPTGAQTLGVIVDGVHEVIDITPDQVDPPPDFGTEIAAEYLHGMLRHNQKIVLLLELDKVLAMEQLEALMSPH